MNNFAGLCRILRQQRGSDLHLVTGELPYIRIHGEVQPMQGQREKMAARDIGILMRQALGDDGTNDKLTNYANTVLKQFETEHEWDGAATIENERYRLNYHMVDGGLGSGLQPGLSVRALDAKAKDPREIGVPESVVALCEKPHGIVLVTGPTGSGKSTTLAALVDYINQRKKVTILTIEDPIEFVHTSKLAMVRQREVGRDTVSFSEGIRRALRQDPDVVLVGEMRDLDTIEAALTLAETGHLVFATLHTPDAPGAIDRIIDVFPEGRHAQIRTQLSLTMRGVIAQRLVPTADGNGRVAAFEVLLDSNAIRANIRDGKTGQLQQYMLPTEGMMLMERSLANLVRSGKITIEAARANSERPQDLDNLLADGFSSEDASGSSDQNQGRFRMRGN